MHVGNSLKVIALFCSMTYCTISLVFDSKENPVKENTETFKNGVFSRKIASLPSGDYDDINMSQLTIDNESDYEATKSKREETLDDEVWGNVPRTIGLEDIFISVKTSGKFHATRLRLILDTWFKMAADQTYFFTDVEDAKYNLLAGGHLINTNCNTSHTRRDLSCKMGYEYDSFLLSNKKWWCHFDDDNYVNTRRLVSLLNNYDWRVDVYIGRASLNHQFSSYYNGSNERFWFATGGAGICVSQALAVKMKPWCWHGKLVKTSDKLKLPDDCTLGFVINNRLGVQLTQSNLLHSHLESLQDIKQESLEKQVSLSYRLGEKSLNRITADTGVRDNDPTKFITLHCMLHPKDDICT